MRGPGNEKRAPSVLAGGSWALRVVRRIAREDREKGEVAQDDDSEDQGVHGITFFAWKSKSQAWRIRAHRAWTRASASVCPAFS